MKHLDRRHGERGSMLLEVVIAGSILTCVSLGAMLVFIPISRQARINREVSMANCEASCLLEKVHAVPFDKIVEIYPNGTEVPLPSLSNGKVLTTYEDPATDPLILRATLTWDSPNLGPMLRTYFTVVTR
jgi:hypothetical protein